MSYKFPFEKLEVWHLSKELAKQIYSLTKGFPGEERFGLISQMNRAAISIASTIAEGSARASRKEQGHFFHLAYGSLMELMCQLTICFELGYVKSEKHESLRKEIEKISNKLNALRKYQFTVSSIQQLHDSTTQQKSSTNQR